MKYRGFLLATAGGLAAASGAQAADLPIKAAPMYAPPPVNWSGWYIGANAGGIWEQAQNTPASQTYLQSVTTSGSGFIGGGQIGFNWQNGNAVYGIEADISGTTAKGFADIPYGVTATNKIEWLSTVRGRMGLAVGNAMAYATAGVAFGGVNNTYNIHGNSFDSSSQRHTRVGWVVGGGIEHMWSRNWTWGLEGLFVDLGHSDVTCQCGEKTTRFSNQAIIGRLKLNYKW
jgi:outer membrane immunogenic protein